MTPEINSTQSSHVIEGVTVPVTTPMTLERQPDAALLGAQFERIAAAQVDTIMLLGTNGEGATVRTEVTGSFCVDAAALWRETRGPSARVLVAVFGSGTDQTLDAAHAILPARPDAVVVAPPHYFIHTEQELAAHFSAMRVLNAPIVAYNIPRYSNNPISLSLFEQLFAMPHIVGMKDSGGSKELIERAAQLSDTRHDFAVSQGNEKMLDWGLANGARGVTPGVANLAPAACRELVEAVAGKDMARAAAIQARLTALTGIHAIRPGVAAMKAAMSLLGLCPPTPGAPFAPYDEEELARLRLLLGDFTDILSAPLLSGERA